MTEELNQEPIVSEYSEADLEEAKARAAELEKKIKTLESQKEHWREKAVKVQEPVNQDDKDFKEVIDLRLDGYSREEVDFLQRNGGRKALENPYVKTAIEKMREQARSEKAVVDDTSGKSEFEKKYSDADLQAMSLEELEKLIPKA